MSCVPLFLSAVSVCFWVQCALWAGAWLLRLAVVTSVAIFDATEDSELEMLMLEKLPTLTVFQLDSSVEWRQLCIYKHSVLRDCLGQ